MSITFDFLISQWHRELHFRGKCRPTLYVESEFYGLPFFRITKPPGRDRRTDAIHNAVSYGEAHTIITSASFVVGEMLGTVWAYGRILV